MQLDILLVEQLLWLNKVNSNKGNISKSVIILSVYLEDISLLLRSWLFSKVSRVIRNMKWARAFKNKKLRNVIQAFPVLLTFSFTYKHMLLLSEGSGHIRNVWDRNSPDCEPTWVALALIHLLRSHQSKHLSQHLDLSLSSSASVSMTSSAIVIATTALVKTSWLAVDVTVLDLKFSATWAPAYTEYTINYFPLVPFTMHGQQKSIWLMYSRMILWTNLTRNILSASLSEESLDLLTPSTQ